MHVIADSLLRGGPGQSLLPSALAGRLSLVTVGVFDGIHLGHQHLIAQLIKLARQRGWLAGVITFYPHPAAVLTPHESPLYLTTPGEKVLLLDRLGVDWTAILAFNPQMAVLSPTDFMLRLYHQLGMRGLCASDDFALGHHRSGDLLTLQALGQKIGFEVYVVPPLNISSGRVSSSRIRACLKEGDVETAAYLLGRPYRLAGEVVHGAKRGRRMGFPTANLAVNSDRVVPGNGVYATWAYLGDERYLSVTNVGTRPSFDNGVRSIEVHLLEFSDDIYGYDLALEFVARLRSEARFADLQTLIAQIAQDVMAARQILSAGQNEV